MGSIESFTEGAPARTVEPERPDVFVSYSRADSGFVERLVAALTRRGKVVWVDWEDIRKSVDWRAAIQAGIESATVVVPILSPDFASSSICRDETEHALRHNKRLVPIVCRDLDGVQLRDELIAPNWIFFLDPAEFEASVDELVAAVEADHDWLDTHARLLVRALEWERRGRDRSFLLHGADLKAAEEWSWRPSGRGEAATSLQREYIVSSRRAATRRLRITRAAALLGAGIATALAVLAWTQRNAAVENAQQTRSRELAAISLSQLRVDPTLALLLAREAARVRPTAEAEQALRSALVAYRPTVALRGARGYVSSASFGAGGQFAVVAGDDGTVRVWDARSGRLRRALAAPPGVGALRAAALAPDGDRIVAAAGGALLVWSFLDGRLERILHGPDARGVNGLAFDPTGSHLATIGDGAVGVWNTDSWRLMRRLPATAPVSASFSPNGRLLVATGDRGGVRLWTADGRLVYDLHGSRGPVSDAAFAPDGSTVAAADAFRGTVHVWSTRTGKVVSTRRGPSGFVFAVTVRDGAPLVATAGEGVIRVWNAGSGLVLDTLATSAAVADGGFSPDGADLVAGGDGGVARIWGLQAPPKLLRPPAGEGVVQLSFDASGRRLVGIDDAPGDAHVWNVGNGHPVVTVRAGGHQIRATAVSHDGRRLATGDSDGMIRIWALDGARLLGVLRAHTDAVETVAWSSDDRRIVSAADDGTARLWDVATRRSLRTFQVGSNGAADASVSRDGRSIAAVGVEGSIGIWDARTGRRIETLPNPGKAGTLVWSPNGRLLATAAGADQAVRIFSVPRGGEVSLLRDVGQLDEAVFSSDGKRLETLGGDGVARVWDVRTGLSTVVARLRAPEEPTQAISPDGSELASANWDTVSVVRCTVCVGLDGLVRLADDSAPRTLTIRERALYLNSR